MSENVIAIFDGAAGDISEKKFVVAVSTFNKPVTEKLLDGVHWQPFKNMAFPFKTSVFCGCPELGNWHLRLDESSMDAMRSVCLGAVIRGETTHDQHINSMISNTLGQLSVDTGKPIAFGVLTCNTADQAYQRSGGKVGNKGDEATLAAIHMLRLIDQIQ